MQMTWGLRALVSGHEHGREERTFVVFGDGVSHGAVRGVCWGRAGGGGGGERARERESRDGWAEEREDLDGKQCVPVCVSVGLFKGKSKRRECRGAGFDLCTHWLTQPTQTTHLLQTNTHIHILAKGRHTTTTPEQHVPRLHLLMFTYLAIIKVL